jgi:drug/metabolite transporter (DMT)-like permease
VNARGWGLFAAVSLLWGIPYLLIKVAIEDGMTPGFLAWVRCAIGSAAVLPFALASGAMRGLLPRWRLMSGFALIQVVLPWPLIAFGEQRISSSLTAILIGSMPLLVALFALRFDPEERPGRLQLAGLLMGMAGVVALVGIDVGGHAAELLGAICVLLAALGYAAGPVIVKLNLPDAEPLGIATVSLMLAAVMLAPVAAFSVPAEVPALDGILAILVLSIACSAVAFIFFFALVREVGPSRAAVTTYVNPVVAVTVGVLVLDESIGAGTVAAMGLILLGSWIATMVGPGARAPEPVHLG